MIFRCIKNVIWNNKQKIYFPILLVRNSLINLGIAPSGIKRSQSIGGRSSIFSITVRCVFLRFSDLVNSKSEGELPSNSINCFHWLDKVIPVKRILPEINSAKIQPIDHISTKIY